jgi:hypothetical protein
MVVAGILCCYVGLVFYFNSRIACCDLSSRYVVDGDKEYIKISPSCIYAMSSRYVQIPLS